MNRAAAERWARTWERGWNEGDVESIVALYADDAIFSSHPFRPPYPGPGGVREYVSGAFAEESGVTARFATPIVGEDSAAVSWWATLVENGEEITLAGTSVLRFDAEGLVVEQWDTWHQAAGRVAPSGLPFPPTER
jgi:hypothetical protein